MSDSEITTSVQQGDDSGGNILVDPTFIILDNSSILANASAGRGGNITLIGDYIIRSAGSLIDASADENLGGISVDPDIDATEVEVDTGENSLAADFLDASSWIRQACAYRSGTSVSSFVIARRPLRPSPGDAWWAANPIDF